MMFMFTHRSKIRSVMEVLAAISISWSTGCDGSNVASEKCEENLPETSHDDEELDAQICSPYQDKSSCEQQEDGYCVWYTSKRYSKCDGTCSGENPSGVCVTALSAENGCLDPCDAFWRQTIDGVQVIRPGSCFVYFPGWNQCTVMNTPECDCGCQPKF